MAFTSWSALRTAIKDAIADHVAGAPCVGSWTIGDKTVKYRTFEELCGLLDKTYAMESLESPGDPSTRVSYGKHRRFR